MQRALPQARHLGKIKEIVREHLRENAALLERVATELDGAIAEAAVRIEKALKRGGKVLLFGNGGSAADAQHIAAELVGRFEKERHPLPAVALVSNPSNITAIGNDYGFERVFARQVLALARKGDILVAISTSGNSPNVLEALREGRALGCYRIGLLGRGGGVVRKEVELAIIVPAQRTCHVQEVHIAIGHIICNLLEERLFRETETE